MPVSCREVHKPPLGDDEEGLAVRQHIALDVVARVVFLHGQLLKPRHVHLHVEVAGVGEDGPVLHRLKMRGRDDAAAAGDGDEDITDLCRLAHGHDLIAVHHGLQGTHGIGLGHDDLGPHALGAHAHALAAPAVAGDHHVLARDDEIRRAHDAVPHGLARAVAVVEHVLAVGFVYHHHREAQLPGLVHGPQAVDAGGGLLTAADHPGDQVPVFRVHQMDEVAPVVDDEVWPMLEYAAEAVLIFLHGAAVVGKDLYPAGSHSRGHIVLRGQGIAARDIHLGPALFQHTAEIGRLGLHMHRQGDLEPFKGLFPDEKLLDPAQGRHVPFHPVDLHLAGRGEGNILDQAHGNLRHYYK